MTNQPETFAVLTGPIRGSKILADGTEYNIDPFVVQVASLAHAHELADLIAEHYATHGHPHHDSETPFVHDVATTEANRAANREG